MKKLHIKDFYRGWIIGDFEPSLFKTKDVEMAIITHTKGEIWPKHYHKIATEYNVLLDGEMLLLGKRLTKDDVFVINPGEIADPVFLEDCRVLCVKIPSIIGDKYEVI